MVSAAEEKICPNFNDIGINGLAFIFVPQASAMQAPHCTSGLPKITGH